jgi:hypothetical protein
MSLCSENEKDERVLSFACPPDRWVLLSLVSEREKASVALFADGNLVAAVALKMPCPLLQVRTLLTVLFCAILCFFLFVLVLVLILVLVLVLVLSAPTATSSSFPLTSLDLTSPHFTLSLQ